MGENVVHVQTVHEHLGPRIELFLTPLGFFFFRQDHDVPLGQLGGQSHVLAAPTYGEAELFVGTTTSIFCCSSSRTTFVTSAGASPLTMNVAGSGDH